MLNLVGRALAVAVVPKITQVGAGKPFSQYFSDIINVALYVAGGLAVLYLIYGGVMYVTAGGDSEKATQARTAIVNSIIGIVVIVLALVLVTWVGKAATGTTSF